MPEIIGLGFEPQQKWGTRNTNSFMAKDKKEIDPYTGHPVYKYADDWVNANNGDYNDFWALRTAKLNSNVKNIFETNMRKGGFSIQPFLEVVDSVGYSDVKQVLFAQKSWDAFMDMYEKGKGQMYGIDIETFGDITHSKGVFGITEVGINHVTDFKNKAYSIAIGIDNTQAKYLRDLVDKFEHQGWGSLSDIEQVSLKRISKYGGKITDRFKDGANFSGTSGNTPIGRKNFTLVQSLLPDSLDAETMREGINNLNKIISTHKHTNPKDVMESVMDFLKNKQDSLFYAANSEFDLNGLSKVAMRNGVDVPDAIDKIKDSILDVTYLVRAAASTDGQSVSSWLRDIYGKGGGADMENLLDVFRIEGKQEHLGASDLINEFKVLLREGTFIYDTYRYAFEYKYDHTDILSKKNTIFYMRKGQFDKTNADDFAYVPDKTSSTGYRAAPNYAITEEFWRIDTERSGQISVDGEDKYRLVMTNEADRLNGIEPTRIVLSGETQDDVVKRLQYMAEAVDFNENATSYWSLQSRNVIEQQQYHYTDLGRREFDKMFNPNDVRIDKKEDVNGYAALKKNLEIEDLVSTWEKENDVKLVGKNSIVSRQIYEIAYNDADKKATKEIEDSLEERIKTGDLKGKTKQQIEDIKQEEIESLRKKKMKFSSDSDAQAFVGMRKAIQNRRSIFDEIVSQIDSKMGNATNIDKTIVAQKAFEDIMNRISSTNLLHEKTWEKDKKVESILFSDMVDIDVISGFEDSDKGRKPIYSRIDGYNKRTIASSLDNLYKKMSSNDIIASIEDLKNRKIIEFVDEKDYQKLLDSVAEANMNTKKSYNTSMYFLAQDVSEHISNPYSYFSITEPGERRTNHYISHDFAAFENPHYGSKGRLTLKKIYDNNKSLFEKYIADSIEQRPSTVYGNKELTEDQINILLENLNMTKGAADYQIEQKKKAVREMFKGNSGYAIGERENLQSFLINNENGSSYLFITRDKDSQRLYQKLIDDVYDFSSYASLRKSIEDNGGYLGSMFELPKLGKYDLGNGKFMTTIKQGPESEKFLFPSLNIVQEGKRDGLFHAYFNDADYDALTLWRRYGEKALDSIESGDYKGASNMGRRTFNKFVDDLPSSASYRRVNGKREIYFGPSDFIQSERMDVMDGLKKIFAHMANQEINDPNNLNIAQKIVYELGKAEDINTWMLNSHKHSLNDYIKSVMNNDIFDQFISSRMVIGKLSQIDSFAKSSLKDIDDPILEIIRKDVMENYKDYGFAKDVVESIGQLPHASKLNPIGTETAIEKGALFTAMPGEYNQFSSVMSIMRPLYTQQSNGLIYDVKKAQKDKGVLFKGFDDTVIRYGTSYLEDKEFTPRKTLMQNNVLTGERNFLMKVKYMSDFELQDKVQGLSHKTKNKDFRNRIMKEFGLSEDEFFEVAKVFQRDMFSLHEDNGIISSGLKMTDLFQSRESMKYKVSLTGLDESKTMSALNKILGKKIDSNIVMYIKKNGQPVFYNGPEAVFSRQNYDTILNGFADELDSVSTYLDLTEGTIFDDKMIINGNEKFTTHSINLDLINKITGFSKERDIHLSNEFFSYVTDGAAAVLNPKSAKHGMVHTALTNWNTMIDFYTTAGQQDVLVNYLNNFTKTHKKLGEGVGEFRVEDGRIIGNMTFGKHNVAYVNRIINDMRNGRTVGLISDINKQITDFIDENAEKNISYVLAQRQHMTEFLGKKYIMDQRTEQSMLMRGMDFSFNGGMGINPHNEQMVEDLRNYSKNYNGRGSYFSQFDLGGLQEIADTMSIAQNADKIRYSTAHKDMERTIKGVIETIESYRTKPITSKNLKGRNIVEFNINDMIDSAFWSEGGISTDDLRSSLFYVDGRPSALLAQKAERQGVDLDRNSYSVFINLNRDIKTKNGITDGFLVPIQNVNSLSDDRHYFQKGQGETTKLINQTIDIMKHPGRNEGKTIDSIYENYIEEMSKQLNYMEKDSDFTKSMNQYAIPTSSYVLGQDEASPLLESQMGKEFKDLYKEKLKYERKITGEKGGAYNLEYIEKYQKASMLFQEKLDELANEIRFNEAKFSHFAALTAEGNKKMAKAMEVIGKNGKKYHGMGIALGREGFKAQGLSFTNMSMALATEIEMMEANPRYKGQFDKIKQFKQNHYKEYLNLKEEISKIKFQDGNNNIVSIDVSKPMMEQLEGGLTTKHLNDAIAGGKTNIGIKRIVDLFETSGLAEAYLSEYGTYGDFFRSPIFRSQPVVKVMLDESIKGRQGRFLDPTMSMLSNIDFDGDTGAIAIMLDGGIILPKTSRQWLNYNREWKRFAEQDSNRLLADLIQDGAAFRSEAAYAPNLQQSTLLKIVNEEAYEKGMQSFLDNHYIELDNTVIDTIAKAKDYSAVVFAAENSNEMATVFENTLGNTLLNENMTLAAYAAKKRKEYIGKVSTPAFRIRSALIDTMDSANITKEQKLALNDVLVGFDNMLSERGGFMAVSEQKGIDTKFAKDAIKYTRLSKWAGAINSIIKNEKDWTVFNNVKSIMEAIGPNVYGITTDQEFHDYADLILNTSDETWKKTYQTMMKDLRENGEITSIDLPISKGRTVSVKDLDTVQELFSLSSFTRVIRDIPELSKVFKERYDKDNFSNFFFSVHNRDDIEALRKQVRNTPARSVVDVAESINSGFYTPYKKDHVYFKTQTIFDDYNDTKYYVADGANKFHEFDIKDELKRHESVLNQQEYHGNSYFEGQKGFNYSDIRRNLNGVRNDLDDAVMTERLYNTINRLTLNKRGLRTSEDKQLRAMFLARNDDIVAKSVDPTLADRGRSILEWLHSSFNSQDMDEVENYMLAYEKARALGRNDEFSSGMDLIKAMNRKIAEDGWKDLSGLDIPNTGDYSNILRPYVMDVFHGEDNYHKFLDLALNMQNFDDKKYAEAIDSLNGKLYDIDSLKTSLGAEYDRLAAEKDHWINKGTIKNPDTSALDALLSSSKNDFINARMNSLLESNANIISKAQQEVYDMLSSDNQVEALFGLDLADKGSRLVGFGEYMGREFKDLSSSDIDTIMNSSFDDYAEGLSSSAQDRLRFAMEGTKNALKDFEPTGSGSAITKITPDKSILENTSSEVQKAIDETIKIMQEAEAKATSESAEEGAEQAAKTAGESLKMNTLRDKFFGSAKETFNNLNISKKTVGVTAGALAALGILNGIIHNDAPHSPLSPSRTSNNNNDPYLKNNETQYPAPPSPKGSKTVYHHRGSGLNFKVNARTKNMIDAQNNAKLIGLAGGGQPSIHSYADMSGVTNNWLENKFAELAN